MVQVQPCQLILKDDFNIDSITAMFTLHQLKSRSYGYLLTLNLHSVKNGGRFYSGERSWSQLSVNSYFYLLTDEVDQYMEALA
eukprot:snap_masked-scaffold_16-processed-gene-4.10-mRNA-1 protein AED:1.00 eAED:1.00 QI:0/-1/0/0/-1/1/1/0/82